MLLATPPRYLKERGPSVPQMFGMGTLPRPKRFDLKQRMWHRSVFLGGLPRPHPKGRGPNVPPPVVVTSYIRAQSMRDDSLILR